MVIWRAFGCKDFRKPFGWQTRAKNGSKEFNQFSISGKILQIIPTTEPLKMSLKKWNK